MMINITAHISPRRALILFSTASVMVLTAYVGQGRADTLSAVSAATVDASASASAPPSSAVSEVVVTAARRGSQNVKDTPIAIDAYSGKALQQSGVQSLQDISKIDPSFDIQNKGPAQQTIIIRGISSSVGSTTGLYLDEAPMLGGFNANNFGDGTPAMRLHDIDHVEILKGPQGTLFGAGSMDGTLRAITAKPKLNSFESSAEGTVAGVDGGNAYYDGDGMVNLPVVTDKLGARIVLWSESGGGFIDHVFNGVVHNNVNDEHLYGGRVEVLFKPIDNFSLLGSYSYQSVKVDGAQSWTLGTGSHTVPGGPENGPFQPYYNEAPSQEPFWSEYRLYSVTAQYDFDYGSIVATGTRGNLNQIQVSDTSAADCAFGFCEGGGLGYPAAYESGSTYTDTTGDIRFSSKFPGPFQLVTGLYYQDDLIKYYGNVENASLTDGSEACLTYFECVAKGLDTPYGDVEFANQDNLSTKQYAVYAQGDYKILSNLTATLGIRYFAAQIHDEQINDQNIYPDYVFGIVDTPYQSGRENGYESKTTYNASLLYAYSPDISFYARAASGFRIGGTNEAEVIASQEGIAVPAGYAPDTLWDYEGGVKAFMIDRSLYVDLSVFHIDWTNEQITAEAGGTFPYTLNVGGTSNTGFELSGTYNPPIQGLTLGGGVTYVNAFLTSNLPLAVVESGTPGMKGDPVPDVPAVSATGHAAYERPLTDKVTGYGQLDFNYRGESQTAFRSSTPAQIVAYGNDYNTKLPAYVLVNLRVGARYGNYDFSVFCDNVANTVAYEGVTPKLDAINVFSSPRRYGIHVAAHF